MGPGQNLPTPLPPRGQPFCSIPELLLPVQGGELLMLFLGKWPLWDMALDILQLG
jgi:hypothetical protein